ncbi:PEP/pyruvate-binding domain-containing protein [Eilatimonas milleporae]|uniref:Pyruvate phosphate dikinase-like enzyme n=1 Tax=Eilatimonas milleporae TaxID=911205 RepID=A0A3M0BTD5_9PROT|nr:PEP/pyruvate-binding domain-containing protein [Eilatimonas milleporae]RMB00578.1 pyruvate phosphate dikinase-like enzyme [Eilatimonas milleporae]
MTLHQTVVTVAFAEKSRTLARLAPVLRSGIILDQATLRLDDWQADPGERLDEVLALPWGDKSLIVRSSAAAEDQASQSLAGRFHSAPDVRGRQALADAIEAVFASYGDTTQGNEHVLIQPMLNGVLLSGVAVSREHGSGRPYYVINYCENGDSAAVTGGRTGDTKVVYHFRGSVEMPEGRIGAVIRLLQDVEQLTGSNAVDIEFAFTTDERLPVLLQARPIANCPRHSVATAEHNRTLHRVQEKVARLTAAHPLALGRRSALGVMPDWNPAEIIGTRPRPLAFSLYRTLVMDEVWAQQRRDYGYRDLRGFPLMVDLAGQPFVDIRACFESFIPADLDTAAATRLAEHYMERLLECPDLHDKVEFDIVLSCFTFDLGDRLAALDYAGFTTRERDAIGNGLLSLTKRNLEGTDRPWDRDRAALLGLNDRRRQVMGDNALGPLDRVYWLIADCRRMGTRPFAGLARMGFIAQQMLRSLMTAGLISPEDHRTFMMDLHTVSSQLQQDFTALSRHDFLRRYGHLRPGSYDILSPRYDEAPELYFNDDKGGETGRTVRSAPLGAHGVNLSAEQGRLIDNRLRDAGLDLDTATLFDIMAKAIRDREWAKFEFTRNLSDALALLRHWGETVGLTAEDLSFADIDVVTRCHASAEDPVALFHDSILRGRKRFAITAQTVLPPLIAGPDDVRTFTLPVATPNYISRNQAVGPVVTEPDQGPLDGAIVMLPNADPGFDWLFTHRIAALVTAYGGANSHMAIRASELDLPAVIGAGERLFDTWSRASMLRIDCANHIVSVLPHAGSTQTHRG